MDVIGDFVARERRSGDVAVRTDSRAGTYSYEKFCTNAWKAGNLLRHYGVRPGATVAVDAGDEVTPPPLLALFGGVLLGAAVRFDPPRSADERALVVPGDRAGEYDPAPGTTVLAYGEQTEDPSVAAFEREVWSENPVAPPDEVSPDDRALVAADRSFTHRQLLSAAERTVTEYGLDASDEVALRASPSDPGAVVAGVFAPILAGGTVLVDRSRTGTVAVGQPDAPEGRAVDPTPVV